MPNVQMPNGDVVGFPDDMPSEQIKGMIASKFPDSIPKPAVVMPSFFASNRGVSNPNSATTSDIAKSTVSGLESSPLWLGDTAKAAETGLTRLAGAAYTGMGGELTPEQAEGLTNPTNGPMTSQEVYNKAGAPLYEPKTEMGSAANLLSNVAGMESAKPIAGLVNSAESKMSKLPGLLGDTSSAGALPNFDNFFSDTKSSINPRAVTPQAKVDKSFLSPTQEVMSSIGLDPAEVANRTPAQIKDVKNTLFANGISQSIEDAHTTKNGLYSMADEVGNSLQYDGSKLQSTLENLHNKFVSDPQYDSTPLVRRLDSWKSMFDPDGNITPTRLNKLMDQVQDAYKENPKAPEGEVYSAIQSPLQEHLDAAKEQFPNWGSLVSTADDANYNIMKYTKDDGAFTQKWSPDSDRDFRVTMNKNAKIGDLMGDTGKQLNNITNIQDQATLQKVMAFMPQELQPQFLKEVAENSSSSADIKAIAKGALQTVKGNPTMGLSKIIQGLPSKTDIAGWEPDAATHISDRIAAWRDAGSDAYDAHLQEQQQARGAAATKAAQDDYYSPYYTGPQRTIPSQRGTLALPPPEKAIIPSNEGWSGNTPGEVGAPGRERPYSGVTRHQTQDEANASAAARQNPDNIAAERARADLPNPYPGWQGSKTELQAAGDINSRVGAWDKASANLQAKGLSYKEITDQIGLRPSPVQTPGSGATAATPSPYSPTRPPATSNMSIPDRFVAHAPNQQDLDQLLNFQNPKYARGGAVNTDPTEMQKLAGNYKKGHMNIHGLNITIENPKGSVRRGKSADGKEWEAKLPADYGYLKGYPGVDGDHMDCYIGPNKKSNRVYVIHQKELGTKKLDEHKCMVGFLDRDQAVRTYHDSFSDGKGKQRIMRVERMSIADFKKWLGEQKNGN